MDVSSNIEEKAIDNKQEILNILAYSDIFNYPLTKEEIYERGKIEFYDLENCLLDLINDEKIFHIETFYSLHNNATLITNRKKRNKLAQKFISSAKFITKIISKFPFIRGVFLSGSISKNCMDKNSDIDFFIITAPKRLWIAHLFCSVFRRTILLNRSKYFCYNYLIDSDHLVIDEKSIYTAIEIKTLIPILGYEYYKNFLKANEWTDTYFPKFSPAINGTIPSKQSVFQKYAESIFNNNTGDRFDEWLLNYSINKRKKKLNPKLFQNPNYYTNLQRHMAKSHISDTYPNVMKDYFQKIEQHTYSKVNS